MGGGGAGGEGGGTALGDDAPHSMSQYCPAISLSRALTQSPVPMTADASHHTHGFPSESFASATHVDSSTREGLPSVSTVQARADVQSPPAASPPPPAAAATAAARDDGSADESSAAAAPRMDEATMTRRMERGDAKRFMMMIQFSTSGSSVLWSYE